MSLNFIRDDNATPLHDVAGLRPDFAHVARANTGASVTELSLSTVNVASNRATNGCVELRVTVVGTNAAYFSLGAASTPPADNTTMISLPANSVSYFKALPADASAYHLQNTGAVAIEIVAMV